jgi:type II secretory pathway pseudopilin PulG
MSDSKLNRIARPKISWTMTRQYEGFIFIGLLAIIAMIGVGLLAVNEIWSTARQREKERELLFIGHQFRRAIMQYSLNGPQGKSIQTYPMALQDLLLDPRYPNMQRYLRKIYTDPMTGNNEWGLLKNPNGSIYGVYSLSEDEPIKTDNFDMEDAYFKDATKYTSWAFSYRLPLNASSPAMTNFGTQTSSSSAFGNKR